MDDVVMVHGCLWPCGLGITEEKVEALTRLPARKDDIFIVIPQIRFKAFLLVS